MYCTIDELTAACKEWQTTLLLADWEIVCKFADKDEIPGLAQVIYVREKKQAILKMVRIGDYDNADFPQDQEKSLVHELLHLHLAWTDSFTQSDGDHERYVQLEVSVDSIARALVRTKRNNNR